MTVEMTDDLLVKQLFNHDEEAVKMLYVRYWPMALGFISLNSGSEPDAEDVYQEAIMDFLEKVWKGNFVLTSKLGTYLYAVIRNKWLANIKKRMPVIDLEDYLETGAEQQNPFIEDDPTMLPDYNQLSAVMSVIDEPCRQLLIGYYYKRLSMDQLAKKLAYKNARVVKQQKYRCMEKLKNTLSKLMKN